MKRLSIKTSLIAIMAAIAVSITLLATASLRSITSIDDSTRDIGDYWVERLMTARDIKENFAYVRLALARHGMVEDDAGFDAEGKTLMDAKAALTAAIDHYEAGVRTEKGKALVDGIRPLTQAYYDSALAFIQLLRDHKISDARAYFNGELRDHANAVNVKVGELASYVSNNAAARVEEADATAHDALITTIVIAVLAAAASLFGIYFAVISVANPIQRITGAMRQLAAGDFKSAIPFANRSDELGAMAGAVEIFRKNAEDNRRLEEEAAANRTAAEQAQHAEQQRTEREAEQLRAATTTLGQGLKRLAAGDLTSRIDMAFATEYEPLRADFNATAEQLKETIGMLTGVVSNIDSGTQEISAGANDLSRRTEQQAASLEETAAALDQITTNVTNSSQMTEEASGIARSATQSANQSSLVVAQAEEAMRRIEHSSSQISNIISVIDEIAFQTNLLALNAGVEAARAGEAGKGFAVVAQEVRELAQRSAQAAKEIKELIRNSTSEVSSGVGLVRDTGTALQAISDYIQQINKHMASIATATREQALGLSEINVAVNQMDQTTQQNAAMVEQSTAASASLMSEAGRLRSLVSQFVLPDGHGHGARRQTSPSPVPHATAEKPIARPAPLRVAAGGQSAALATQWEEF